MTVFSGGITEIEFTAGVWTDVSSRVSLRSGIRIRQGRPTEFDQVGAASLSIWLWNDDGALMPDNSASAFYPNVVEGKRIRYKPIKAGVTYTRFFGWIQAIEPEFPTSNTTGAMVHITAVDALGLLAQRKLRSNWTETALWRARADATHCDVYESAGQANGMLAVLTNYSQDASPGGGGPAYSTLLPILSFGSDPNMSIGGTVSCSPDSNGFTCGTTMDLQSGNLEIEFLMKCPTSLEPGGTPRFVCATFISGGGNLCNLVIQNNGGSNALFLYDATLATNLGIIAQLPYGQWVMVRMVQNGGTATHMDVTCVYELLTFGASALTNANIDIRNIIRIQLPGGPGRFLPVTWGGIVALGTTTQIEAGSALVASGGADLATRFNNLASAVNQLPITWAAYGSGNLQKVCNGTWSDRTALDVGQEIMRSGNGLLWARPLDSRIGAYAFDALRPSTPLMTLDLDADAIGPPILTRSVDSRPTRIQVDSPAGSTLVIDTAAEASALGSPQRLKNVNTVHVAASDGRAIASLLLAQASTTRIKQFTVDLNSAGTDPTATLFDESGLFTGLYPTQRLRLTVPSSHFGTSTKDVHVQGWEEQYDTEGARIVMDTTPAITTTLATETFTGTNGAGWPAQWVAGFTATGGSFLIQGNQGRVTASTSAGQGSWRRLNIAAVTDLDYSGSVTFNQAQGTCGPAYRGTSAMNDNCYVFYLGTGGTVFLYKIIAGAFTLITSSAFTIAASTQYRYRIRAQGTMHLLKIWLGSGAEPTAWTIAAVDTTFTGPGYVGMAGFNDGVAVARTFDYDDITLTNGL